MPAELPYSKSFSHSWTWQKVFQLSNSWSLVKMSKGRLSNWIKFHSRRKSWKYHRRNLQTLRTTKHSCSISWDQGYGTLQPVGLTVGIADIPVAEDKAEIIEEFKRVVETKSPNSSVKGWLQMMSATMGHSWMACGPWEIGNVWLINQDPEEPVIVMMMDSWSLW